MSDLLSSLENYIRSLNASDVRVVLGQPTAGDEPPMRAEAEANQAERELAEDGGISAVDVGEPSIGGFCYFMDGMQRPRGPIYVNTPVPILYGYVAAAVRKRGPDKRMSTHSGFYDVDEALYFSKSIAAKYGLTFDGMRCVDTDDEKVVEHPLALVQSAYDKISTMRGKLENKIASRWVREHASDEWLLVDGSLQADYGDANIAGVTKSHATQYLTFEEQRTVLSLKEGQRSGAFVPVVHGRARPVFSWYLRMHSSEGKDPYFGLIRVEVPRSPRALQLADEISRWLLAERAPLSLPDSRWDKMIYPIRDCEMFMKSCAPSHTSLDARLMRLSSLGSK
ncbi:MAG: hypothetical protein ACOX3G_08325 [Armatimonadota bacterium]